MKIGAAFMALALAACSEPEGGQVESNESVQLSKAAEDDLGSCYRFNEKFQAQEFIGYRECYDFLAPQRMKGTWVTEFEGSRFIPRTDIGLPVGTTIWLDAPESMYEGIRAPYRRYFEIEIIGSRSKNAGQYGHLGGAPHIVLVDQLVSMREVSKASALKK